MRTGASIASLERPAALERARVLAGQWPDARAALLGFSVVAVLAVAHGGYFPTAWGWGALALFWSAALALVLRPRLRLRRIELALPAMLTALLGWILASSLWTSSLPRTLLEAERLLLYIAVCAAALFLSRSGSYRALLGGVWAATAVVSSYGLATKLFPERLGIVDPVAGERLSEPLGYWNALGIFAAIGAILAVGFTARARSMILRALAASSLVVLVLTLYFTFSRGAWIALAGGLAAAIAVDRRRLQLTTGLLIAAPWCVAAVAIASRSAALTRRDASLAAAADDGQRVAIYVALLAALAFGAGLAFAITERRVRFPRSTRRIYATALFAIVAALLVGVVARYGSPISIAKRAYSSVNAPAPQIDGDLNRRLFTLSSIPRVEQWRVAWSAYRDDPWLGSGPGTYEQHWLRERPSGFKVIDAHNLYLETLTEMGPAGLALLVSALSVPLVAVLRARRRGLVPAAAGGYAAFALHAAIDWDWEMTAVTSAALLCGAAVLIAGRGEGRAGIASGRLRSGLFVSISVLSVAAFVGVIGNSAIAAGEDALADADWSRAAREAQKAQQWAPWSPDSWRLLAQVRRARGDTVAAQASLRRAIAKDRRDWFLWYQLALATDGTAQRDALTEASRLNPRSQDIRQLRSALAGARR